MIKAVIDSSIIVKWLNRKDEEDLVYSDQLLKDVQYENIALIAPELAKFEVGNVLLKGKKLNPIESLTSFRSLYSLPIRWIPETEDLAVETFKHAYNLDLTYYDAAFLALAKQYNTILITQNIKHQGKTKDIIVRALNNYQSSQE